MIVVADTTPLNYLVLVGHVDLLATLYHRVLIPREVLAELQNTRTPLAVRDWASCPPSWCEVREVETAPDAALQHLDAGEREAIQLALNAHVDSILIDDGAGRREAQRRNLIVTGTLGVLDLAARRGLIDFKDVLARLEQTNFRLSQSLREAFLRRYR